MLHADALIDGLATVLYQEHDDIEKVAAYGSRGLGKTELVFHPTNWKIYVLSGLSLKHSVIICMEIHFLFILLDVCFNFIKIK